MRRIWKLVPALACALAVASTYSARADTVTSVPELTGFQQVLSDTQHAAGAGFLFLSGDGSIVVTSLAGNYVTTLEAGSGVRGLALSADGTTLYAGLTAGAQADSVAAITVATIATGRQPVQSYYALGTGQVPFSLASQSGRLWVSYDQARAVGQAGIISIDLATGIVGPPLASGSWVQAPDLAADPGDSGVLVAVEGGSSAAEAATFDTTTDPATSLSAQGYLGGFDGTTGCEYEQSIAVLPGGSRFIAACEAPANASYYYAPSDISTPLGAYAAAYPDESLAVDADGAVAIGTGGNTPHVHVYRPDGTLMNVFTLAHSNSDGAHSLAWADPAAGAQLAAVAIDELTSTYVVHVFDQPTVTDASITLSAPVWVFPGKSMTLSGTLTFGTGTVPAGTAVTVTRSKSGSTATKRFAVVTGARGGFELTDTPPGIGTYTYTVAYGGGQNIKPARASIAVPERKYIPQLWVDANPPSVGYRGKFQVRAGLLRAVPGPAFVNRTVSIYAQTYGSKARKLLKRGPVNSQGRLTVTYTGLKKTMFTVVYGGDAGYGARTASTIESVQALVTQKLSGYFARGTYLQFHPTAKVRADATVTPDKHGECVRFQVQEYGANGWQPWLTTKCATIGATSHAYASVGLTKADANSVYRIRADYVAGSSSNASSNSAWGYFTVIK